MWWTCNISSARIKLCVVRSAALQAAESAWMRKEVLLATKVGAAVAGTYQGTRQPARRLARTLALPAVTVSLLDDSSRGDTCATCIDRLHTLRPSATMGMVKSLISGLGWIVVMLFASALAYDIRMYAIRGYGYVIHEFELFVRV